MHLFEVFTRIPARSNGASILTSILSNKYPFKANYYENIQKELSLKIKAVKCYKSEIEKFPHPRSIEIINSNSMIRGMEAGLSAAEAFEIKKIISD